MNKNDHKKILEIVKNFLEKNNFVERQSPGLLQPLFGYPFSPSAGHHVIDKIVISKSEPHTPVLKFHVTPDRSLRMYDFDKIGISSRHLSFFETLVFGYAGAIEALPKKESTDILFDLMVNHLKLDKNNIFVTTLGHVSAEKTDITEEEDEIFYQSWLEKLGPKQVARTNGRRNLFYSRVLGNPGGTGCEIYYKIGNKFIEIGSQVNYKFKFTGGLERMRNQAILEGFGFERLLMALEGKENICDTSLLKPFKDIVWSYLESKGDTAVQLYEETLNVISDHIRAISFIIYDGQQLDNSARGKILKDFIKNFHSQFVYLGIDKKDELELIEQLFAKLSDVFNDRYSDIAKIKNQLVKFIDTIINQKI